MRRTFRTFGRLAAALTLAVLLGFTVLLPAAAEGTAYPYVTDERTGGLGEADLAYLCALAGECSRKAGYPLYAVVTDDSDYDQFDFFRASGLGTGDDLVLLIVFWDYRDETWYYDLYTWGEPASLITDREIDLLLDDWDVYHGLKSGALRPGLSAWMKKTAEALVSNLPAPVGPRLTLALVFGILGGGLAFLAVFLRYRMKMRPTVYPLDKYARLTPGQGTDAFTGTTVTSVRINSGSHGSGGGHSHGGGSGHRGGR